MFFRGPSHGVCLAGCDSAGTCILFFIHVSNMDLCNEMCLSGWPAGHPSCIAKT